MRILWTILAAAAIAGCGGDGGGDDITVPVGIPPDQVSVAAANQDATAYRLVVQSWDSSVWPPAVTEQTIADPLPAGGSGGAAVALAPTSASLKHYFALRDLSGVLLAVSAEYVKGPVYQIASLVVSGQAITILP